MTNDMIKRVNLPRFLAGTILVGILAFAAQMEAQQQGQDSAGDKRRGADQRGDRRFGKGGDPKQRVERHVSMLTERLTLSANQAAAIRTILTEQNAQMEALRPQQPPVRTDSIARAQRRAQMHALSEGTNARIDSVLTAEQRVTFQKLKTERGGRWKGGREGGQRGGPRRPSQAPPTAR